MINKIVEFLNNTFKSEGYYVKEFSDELFFGKDKDNNIVCAKKNNSKEQPLTTKTKAIELYQNYHFLLQTENEEIDGNYDMIILKNEFVDTKESFIRLCLNFYNDNSNKNIIELTNDLIEMFKIISRKDAFLEQGLWAEFFTLLFINKKYGVNLSDYWHNDNFNKYDFSLNDNTKIEVKSTIKEIREHRFSHEQLETDYDVIISSVQMRKDDNGYDVFDLYKEVEQLFF